MAENFGRGTGTSKRYRLDAGGAPILTGAFIGIVKNNVDTTRSGRLLVYIEFLSGPDENDPSGWITVNYVSPFYGRSAPGTPPPETGPGSFIGNNHSYGMWFTPPDLDAEVLVFFANGDPNKGYYTGSAINQDAHHMIPAVGASTRYVGDNPYYQQSTQLPVVEFNDNNPALSESSIFFDSERPVHDIFAQVLLQQGLLNDTVRGSIGSNSYRESPSRVFGFSTPGRPIYDGVFDDEIEDLLENNPDVPPQNVKVVGREGGHSIVLDDGDLAGRDRLVRIRTAKGHQIVMSDSGDSLHIIHANGQSWWELGAEGTIDMYATNSVNIRTTDFNVHADGNVNINSGLSMNLASDSTMNLETQTMQLTGENSILAYSESLVGIKSDGTLSLDAGKNGTWKGGTDIRLSAGLIDLNGPAAPSVPATAPIVRQKLPDVYWEENQGWTEQPQAIDTIATRVPTHEPYPFHDQGVNVKSKTFSPTVQQESSPPVQEKIDSVQDTEIETVDTTDYEKQPTVEKTIGSIQPEQLKGMLAQASKQIAQNPDVISNAKGLGKYGFNATQLEKVGLLKPGISEFFLQDSTVDFETVMASPSVWSGKDGVNSLNDLLNDPKLQDFAKSDLLQQGLTELRQAGLVTGFEDAKELGAMVSVAGDYDVATFKNWINDNASLGADLTDKLNQVAKGANYSVELADTKITEAIKGYSTTSGQTVKAVSRETIDVQTKQVLTTTKTRGVSYTRVSESAAAVVANRDEIFALEAQILEITKKEIPAAKTAYLDSNPDKKFRDFLRTSEYKTLVEKRNGLRAELDSLRGNTSSVATTVEAEDIATETTATSTPEEPTLDRQTLISRLEANVRSTEGRIKSLDNQVRTVKEAGPSDRRYSQLPAVEEKRQRLVAQLERARVRLAEAQSSA